MGLSFGRIMQMDIIMGNLETNSFLSNIFELVQ